MVEFKEFESEIPSLLEEVRRLTGDVYGFQTREGKKLPTEPCLLEEGYFRDELSKIGLAEYSYAEAFLRLDNRNIYLNFNALDNELYKESTLGILLHFAPLQFVLYETEYGNWLTKEAERAVKKGRKEKIKDLLSSTLRGVGAGFELDALKTIGSHVSEMEKEITEYLEENPKIYKGYELYKKLQDKVKPTEDFIRKYDLIEETHTREKILKASLLVAGRNKNFDSNFEELITLPVEEIYDLAGQYAHVEVDRPPKRLERTQELASKTYYMQLESRPIGDIVKNLKELKEQLLSGGFGKFADIVEEQIKICSSVDSKLPFMSPFVENPLKERGPEQLKKIVDELEDAKQRRIKITFW